MKDLRKRFNYFRELNPNLGDVIIFSMSCEGMAYPRAKILRFFNILVSKEEFDSSEKIEIVDSLFEYSKTPIK